MSGEAPSPIVVTGATGLVGRRLLPALLRAGSHVRVLTRNPAHAWLPGGSAKRGAPTADAVAWDGTRAPRTALCGAAAVVHLAGEPVFAGRLTPARRTRIYESRIRSTEDLAASLGQLAPEERPQVLVCASAVGYYGSRGEELLDESKAPGEGFLARVCVAWEAAAAQAARHGVRVVQLRIGIVLAREGGALQKMTLPFRFGLGGPLGDGRQWVPWIHIDDLVALIQKALTDASITGPVNAVAPVPVRNAELTREIASRLHRPAFLRVPGFMVHALLGELAGELLGSRRAVPQRASSAGFRFAHEKLSSALAAEL
ncbi:MAG TPA: TIGR01777 family oxidoreductase [Myxococcota bacterium]|nr:TIGR01777 family oxidoreductase [Myxococcota bacterium]